MKFFKFLVVLFVILIFFNYLFPIVSITSTTTSSTQSFTVDSSTLRTSINSTVYNPKLQLFMGVEAGILRNYSNPYVSLSYYNSSTNKIVLSTTYVFHQIIEYTPTNSSQVGPDSSTIDKTVNIGTDGSAGLNIATRGYKPITTTNSTYQGVEIHTINITTADNVFSLAVNIPEATVYPHNIEVDVPGVFFTLSVKNFPFTSPTSSLSLDVHALTSAQNTIDTSPNNLFIYKGYDTTYNSTFYLQNASFSDLQTQLVSVTTRDISGYCTFQGSSRENATLHAYIGKINTNPILPGSYFFPISSSASSGNGNAGILDFTVNANALNLHITGTQLAVGTASLAGIAGFIALLYYFLKKYLLYIIGLLMAIGVSIYLPTRKVTAIQALHHEKRQEIMDALFEVGGKGMLMKDLKDLIQVPQTTLLWHLDVLQEFEFITRVKIHKQIIIISNDFLEDFDPRIKELELSFQSDQGKAFRNFISSKDLNELFTLAEVIAITQWHEKTAKRHLKRMITLGIIIPNNTNNYFVSPEFHAYFSNEKE